MRSRIATLVLLICFAGGPALAQEPDAGRSPWLMGVIFKLEKLRTAAVEDITRYEAEIRKCDGSISRCENIISLARQEDNERAEGIAREALAKAQEAKTKNIDLKKAAELKKKRADIALAYVGSGGDDLEARLEQIEFEYATAEWKESQRRLIEDRLRAPNPRAVAIAATLAGHSGPLMREAPPPPPSTRYEDLKPGDVLLVDRDLASWVINAADRLLSGNDASTTSHTVIYLKEVNGRKLFLENIPNEGPRIISGETFLERYGERGGKVAQLAEPLNAEEAKKLWGAAAVLAVKNTKNIAARNWLGMTWLGTDYGVWGEGDLVCSEADWSVLRAAGRDIPESDDRAKKMLGVKFSPADFYDNGRFFVVGSLTMPARKAERLP